MWQPVTTSCVDLPVLAGHHGAMAMTPPSLGARIRRARERARLSQEELATEVGASVRAVGDWENDRRKPRNRLGVLEEVLGVRLVGEPESELPTPEEMERLRAHIREVLGGRAAAVEDAMDAALDGRQQPRRSSASDEDPWERRSAS